MYAFALLYGGLSGTAFGFAAYALLTTPDHAGFIAWMTGWGVSSALCSLACRDEHR